MDKIGGAPVSWMRRAVEEVGADRLLIGSCWPESEPVSIFSQVESLGPSAGDEDKILVGTARRLFGL